MESRLGDCACDCGHDIVRDSGCEEVCEGINYLAFGGGGVEVEMS